MTDKNTVCYNLYKPSAICHVETVGHAATWIKWSDPFVILNNVSDQINFIYSTIRVNVEEDLALCKVYKIAK